VLASDLQPPSFTCPGCGASFRSSDGQTCEYCNQVVANGRFDWLVTHSALRSATRVPPALTGTVDEQGTELPTYKHPQLVARWSPELDDHRERLADIHRELNRAWNEQDLSIARPWVSDGLFDYLRYWVEAYQRRKLHNRVDDAAIVRVEPAALVRDRHFDSLTVRLFATGMDYTVDPGGSVVGGSRRHDRPYSEYWTLIRGRGAQPRHRGPVCPGCGAELAISMAGTCTYCEAHVTSGEFDWVLSKIEQDDDYRG
jgi:hypothetical protein